MALPVDGQIVVGADAAPFISPHNKPKLPLEDWSRGGVALNDASLGLDIYDWRGWCVEATGEVWLEVDGEVAPTLVHTIPDPVGEFAFSFDTNMQPVLGWTTEEGVSWFRWFDPTIPDFVDVLLPTGSYAVRVKHDDSRAEQVEQGVTDTIVAYVRSSMVYYRLLRDRFAVEYPLLNSKGMTYLYQIGMNEGYRFMFSRSGELVQPEPVLKLPIPSVRAGARPLAFDMDGNLVQLPAAKYTAVRGPKGSDVSRTATGSTYHLQDHDGSWIGPPTRGEAAQFFRLPATSLGGRERLWTRNNRGELQLTSDEQAGESLAAYREVERLGTLTGMYRDAIGNGRTFNVVSITEGPAFGSFTPDYAATGDFAPGLAPQGAVRFTDHGAHVTLALAGAHHGASTTNALRWPAGTIPVNLRPSAARSVACIATNDGVTVPVLATVHTDGSVQFTPQTADIISDTPVVNYAIFKVGSTSTDATAAVGATTATTSRWRWLAPAAKIDWLIVGGGGRGGRGNSVPKGNPGNIAGGGGGAGGVKAFLGVEFTPGQPIVINVGRGATDNGGGTEFTAPDIFGSGKNRTGHALSRGGLSGIEGYDMYVSGGGNGGHANRFPANGEPGMSPFLQAPANADATRAGGGGGAGNDPGDDQIGGAGWRNGGDSLNPGTNYSGGGGGGGAAAGTAGIGGNCSGSDNEHGGDGGDGVTLASLGWGDAVAAVGAPATICAGGGGAGYRTASVTGTGGAGGSNGVGGAGANGTAGSGAPGGAGAPDSGSGGGGACGNGTPGSGANGFVLARWVSAGQTFGLLTTGSFTAGGTKGLPADFTLTYPK